MSSSSEAFNMEDKNIPHLQQASNSNWTILFICWLIVSIATLGSLFFSEIMNFPPCDLCWYQRIFIYPLAIIIPIGLFPFDKAVIKYSLPLVLIGWSIALYQNLLYYGIIPESIKPCSQGVSCTEEYINILGIFSIPMLSLIAFSIVGVLLIVLMRRVST
ncbi:MAG: disulfide bond formation protein B [Thermoleophilia bacterium]